mgnify:CR=1 FL=1
MAVNTALVVDDSKSARIMLSRLVQKNGLEVNMVESGEEALAYLESAPYPDVIFMDHMMPGMDGFQAVQAIKNDPKTATIPIVMYTSKEDGVYVSQARALGAVGVIPKKLKPVQLEKVLVQLNLIAEKPVQPELAPEPIDIPEPTAATRAAAQSSLEELAMSGSEDGIMCGNLAQFYAYLCECENNPRTPEQARMLRATLMQIKSTYENYGSPCNGIRTLPTPGPCKVGATGAARGRGAQSEAQKIQQSINNFRRAKGMIERARNRAKQAAAELDSRVRINANGSPGTIMGDFNQSMQAIKGIDARLREDITVGYINDAASVVQDYSAGNMEGAGYGVLGVLGSIAENEEAKERVKEKRNQLIREKNRALRNAANKMIDINNAALEKWLDLASSALEEDREMYFMNKAFFHSCFARSVANNFNTANYISVNSATIGCTSKLISILI